MKKPNIDSLRETKFSSEIQGLRHLPNSEIVKRLNSKMFPLDGNQVFHYKPEILAGDEYKRCLELFERRLPSIYSMSTGLAASNCMSLIDERNSAIIYRELKHADALKKIAVDTIRDLFDIPEHLVILPEIDSNLDLDHEQDDAPDSFLSLSEQDKRDMRDEINKRVILNGLVHGSAMHIWKSAHYIIKEQIDNLDPLLMSLYDEFTTSVGWLLWQMNPASIGEDSITQGFNKLEFEEPGEAECSVHCHAINFPVLLHEITKGTIDYLICHGIPKNYSEEQLDYYYAKADNYENEIWHYLMSPSLWIKLIEAAEISTQEVPLVIARLTQLNYNQLTEVMKSCIDGKENGRMKLLYFKIV
jgi:hypothetical protein